MSDVLDPWADEVYAASLEPRPRSTLGCVVLGALDLWCATTGGTLELTRAGDVVVRRRVDGVEELRVPVRAAVDAGPLLEDLREQLETLSPEEFRGRWGLA